MKMNKREYAQEIANEINAKGYAVRAEVQEVNKPNGVVLTGINIREEGVNASPNLYVDEWYDKEVDAYDAANRAIEIYYQNKVNIDIEWVQDYEQVKGKLVACLYNECNAEAFPVHQSAKKYGFDDLIITARIKVDLGDKGKGSILVRPEFIEKWGVTKAEVIRQAMENVKEDIVIKSTAQMLAELIGVDDPELLGFGYDEPKMLAITNTERTYGAISVLNAKRELCRQFPNGYTVLPSSIHEVIVVGTTDDEENLTGMVGEVNTETVDAQEQLSNHAYVFKGEVA